MQSKFTQGSILRHICNMTFASMAGLLSLFLVDLVDMYWLSLLGEIELAAAIGYAGSILFFTLSLSIGLSIGVGATVSQSVGGGDRNATRRLVGNIAVAIVLISIPVMLLVVLLLPVLLGYLGAEGRAHELALSYAVIVLPSMPLMAGAMAASGVMRALGNAKEAMYLTLLGGAVNAALDPLLIFTFGLGIEGAAWATVLCRVAMLAYGIYLLVFKHRLIARPKRELFARDFRRFAEVALPAALTNLSTPVGVAYVTAVMAGFGDSAVAGNAIVGKVQALAFAGLFALSGSVGPIVGQNLGAGQISRIMETLKQSVVFVLSYCLVACLLLFALTEFLVAAFNASGEAAELIRWFCWGLSTAFVFNGLTFCSNAFFNNLKVAHWATVINFAKATIFTMPFAYIGAQLAGPVGIFIGMWIGSAIIAVIGLYLAWFKVRSLPGAERAGL
ncbi:MATE family efflux transporter [Agaribacterium haliotis]|uniref:MATE family efflux transporter n=1 Tax=Agaribacterium haliotis TaxID=2013869 RepID=UPI000BB54D47|nr:MATE family efflux transporter [Agaribacterium haliotis]